MNRRRFLGTLAATSAWMTAPGLRAETETTGVAPPAPSPREFTFVQLADPQLGFKAWGDDLTHEIGQFERAATHVNRLRPAFVIISGDLVNMPRTRNKLTEFDRLRGLIDPSIPVHVQPGNHDLGNVPDAAALGAYRERYGRDYYSFDTGRTHFVNLNSQLIFSSEALPAETARQWDWLVTDLAGARRRPIDHIVVFCHYPWFLDDPDEVPTGDRLDYKTRGYYMIPAVTRRRYLDLLGKYEVGATFSGHFHGNVLGRRGGMEMVTSGPVSVSLHPDTPEGYRVVEVSPAKIAHRYYPL
ncbi:MAG TPA: metallophosphoesterase [Rariglobus sp.]